MAIKDTTDKDKETVDVGISNWADAIRTRLEDELPFGDDNLIIAEAIYIFLLSNPSEVDKFIGTSIIEEDYFDKLS